MGYWEEKAEYEEESEKKHFCNICGRKLNPKSTKGKCIKCKKIVCNSCGNLHNNKVVCINCKQEFIDDDNFEKQLKEDRNNFKKRFKKRTIEEELGLIPLWVVFIGFFFYIIPGIILLLIRESQLRKRNLKKKG